MFVKFIAFLILISALTLLALKLRAPDYPVINDGLLFQRIDGAQQSFAELKGKPLLVTFWSPSCTICMHEVEDFNRLYQQMKGGSEFEMLALSMYYDRPDQVVQTSQQKSMQYPVYLDLKNQLAKAFGNIVATPTTFLINASGEIIYRHTGKLDFNFLTRQLSQISE
jgi:peroxiredoxin